MHDMMIPDQVADYLRLDAETVYRLIRTKRLIASKVDRTFRVRQADVDAFLLADSADPDLREALFARVSAIAER